MNLFISISKKYIIQVYLNLNRFKQHNLEKF